MSDTYEITQKIARVLEPVKTINYAFLFGSALKRLSPQSDIDILIGGEIDFDQRLLLMAKLSGELSRNVDLVLVKEARYELVLKAMSQGMSIFIHDKEILKQDYINNFRAYDNNAGLRRIRFARIQREYTYGR
jgi:predicted nucleotidyltransferase